MLVDTPCINLANMHHHLLPNITPLVKVTGKSSGKRTLLFINVYPRKHM